VRTLTVPLERMPVFARAGAIVPLQEYRPAGDTSPPARLVVEAYPGRRGTFDLYEDGGDGLSYRRGAFARTRIGQRRRRGVTTVSVGRARGAYAGGLRRRSYELRIFGSARPRKVTVAGRRLHRRPPGAARGWWYDAKLRAVFVRTARLRTARRVRVLVRAGFS
jgi:hypothetical protein